MSRQHLETWKFCRVVGNLSTKPQVFSALSFLVPANRGNTNTGTGSITFTRTPSHLLFSACSHRSSSSMASILCIEVQWTIRQRNNSPNVLMCTLQRHILLERACREYRTGNPERPVATESKRLTKEPLIRNTYKEQRTNNASRP